MKTPDLKSRSPDKKKKLREIKLATSLTGIYVVIEMITGYFTNSLSMTGDAFHMLIDLVALIFAYFALRSSDSIEGKPSMAYIRANVILLIIVVMWIIKEAVSRLFLHNVQVIGPPVLMVAGIGIFINLLVYKTLHHHKEESTRAAIACALTDAVSLGIVILSGLIITINKNLFWVDPIASLAIVYYLGKVIYENTRLAFK